MLPIPQLKISTEVWAQLELCENDCQKIRDYMTFEMGIKPRHIVKRMHITIYHARRSIPGVANLTEAAVVTIPVSETRFMVMAPGGENPRPDLEPARRKIGIRVHRQSAAIPSIMEYRARLLRFETSEVLGRRSPSTARANAFGARHYQPHMTLLRAGSGVNRDLQLLGIPFREAIGDLTFDRFSIEVKQKPYIE